MKALVITGSRADRNGLEVVHEALLKAGHESKLFFYDGELTERFADVAIVGGDRIEILEAAVDLSGLRIPIAHIAGGDTTLGSADNRYRDAITALACIHFATNEQAFQRLRGLAHTSVRSDPGGRDSDTLYMTGSPAIDRIKQTPVYDESATFTQIGLPTNDKVTALVCVHPNTSGHAPQYEAWVTRIALSRRGIQTVCIGANADKGQAEVNQIWRDALEHKFLTGVFIENVSPQLYYSLMTHCDVMVGNSSAMLYEAPCFGLPCVLVGDRQEGRPLPDNVLVCPASPSGWIVTAMEEQLERGRRQCDNPYGDGHSAPRIVKALEENEWRWKRD